jgi:hypothetical protein
MRDKRHDSERRGVYRISVAGARIDLLVNGQPAALVDATSEGFAVATRAAFAVDQTVAIEIVAGTLEARGTAVVRNVRRGEHGQRRYGLQTGPCEIQLRRALRTLAITVQRDRLRRAAQRRSSYADKPHG